MSNSTDVIESRMTVNEVIQQHPTTLPVFSEYGIDTCCGGNKTLSTVCEKHGFELPKLLEQLNRAV